MVQRVGEVFAGRFELLEPVAEGGMGSVWQVLDRKDGQVYAGKLLRQSDAGSLLRFIREQSTRIEHPHVVTPVSWAGEDDRVLFTMPLVRGGSVATVLGDFGALPAGWVAQVLDQVLQGLEAVHAAGIVHRDLKPANLLLDPTGDGPPWVQISDFGVAAPVDEPRLTRASQVVGSPGYIAPEQLQGADPDPRQDLYGVGMVGLELLTGERPPASLAAARRALSEGDPAATALLGLLLRAADPDPTARPESAAAFRASLGALTIPPVQPGAVTVFDQFAVVPTGPESGSPRVRPLPVNPRQAAWVLLTLGIALLVAAVWVLVG